MKSRLLVLIPLVSAVVGVSTSRVLGWNKPGHMLVAAIAYEELRANHPEVLNRVINRLHDHPEYQFRWANWVDSPGLTDAEKTIRLFMLAARWPDDIRETDQHHGEWHYVNMVFTPGTVTAAHVPSGPGEQNILRALGRNKARLQSDASPAKKAIALCWMFHLIGDVHQPLHAVELKNSEYPNGDRGGDSFYFKPTANSEAEKLHEFWDESVIETDRFWEVGDRAKNLIANPNFKRSALSELTAGASFTGWATESYLLAAEKAYLNGTLKSSQDEENAKVAPSGYSAEVEKVALRRVVIAGYRLADFLKATF